MKIKVAKWGNSLGVRIPKSVAEDAGLKAGETVDVMVVRGEILVRTPRSPPRYRLEDLLAEMDRFGPENRPGAVDWGPDRGAEIIDDDYSRGLIRPAGGRSGVGRPKADTRTRAKRRATGRRAHRS